MRNCMDRTRRRRKRGRNIVYAMWDSVAILFHSQKIEMSCQIRKWKQAGAAAVAAAASCPNTPAKKELDSRLADLMAARAAQDTQWCAPTTTYTYAEHSHPSSVLSSSGKDPRALSLQQTVKRS